MKVLIALAALVAVVSCTVGGGERSHDLSSLLHAVTAKYHGEPGLQRLRRRSTAEFHQIQKNFAASVALADSINSDSSLSYNSEYNHISIMTDAEKAALTSTYNTSQLMTREKRRSGGAGPEPLKLKKREADGIDWVARGATGAVKSQGSCGSCWTFGAMSPLETNYYILTGEKKVFAEQEYLDCAVQTAGYDGCGGGWMKWCYEYNLRTGHMSLSDDVAYTGTSAGQSSSCKWSTKTNGFTKARLVSQALTAGDGGLQTALQSGVVTVAIKVVNSFQTYSSGVYECKDDECSSWINHAVSVVGYGTENGAKYWNIRNSWGGSWGNGGYIKMARDGHGTNGVANIHLLGGWMPVLACNDGQTCTTPEWDESSHEDDDVDDNKGEDVQCGIVQHSGGRCLSIDDSASKFTDLSAVCEREWCTTSNGFLYEKATDLCANIVEPTTNCEDQSTSCSYWAGKGYCTHSYVSYMEQYCAESCNWCGERIRLQGTCTTQWAMTSAGAIKNAESNKCMHAAGATPAEGTPLNPDAACTNTFSFLPAKCWEVEEGKMLSGGSETNLMACEDEYPSSNYCPYWANNMNYCVSGSYIDWMGTNCMKSCNKCPYAIKSVANEASAKSQCKEMGDDCGGLNWIQSSGKYNLVPGSTLNAGSAQDKAMVEVNCDAACNAGETRCQDGDCKTDCGVECNAAAGMRMCPDGNCKHEHMAC